MFVVSEVRVSSKCLFRTKCYLLYKASNLFNIEENGLHLNNRSRHVIGELVSKSVKLISTEKEETITVSTSGIVERERERTFLLSACIMKKTSL